MAPFASLCFCIVATFYVSGLNASSDSPTSNHKTLSVRIISGQHLPKSEEQTMKGGVIEPYVKLRILGHGCDEAEFVTKVVPKVGYAKPQGTKNVRQ